jgi:hypothetical protein
MQVRVLGQSSTADRCKGPVFHVSYRQKYNVNVIVVTPNSQVDTLNSLITERH